MTTGYLGLCSSLPDVETRCCIIKLHLAMLPRHK